MNEQLNIKMDSPHEIMTSTLKVLADKQYEIIMKQGYANPGHNGPYKDQETPVRNTAHWLISYANLYRKYGDKKYLGVINKCADYLISSKNRPGNATFYCRDKKGKDSSNGLMGQAWVIEALCEAYDMTGKDKYINVAKEVFLLHPFDLNFGLWKIVDISGNINNFDVTFNHQLWFAAAGAILSNRLKETTIINSVELFINKLEENLAIYENGLIKHPIPFKNYQTGKIKRIYREIRKIQNKIRNKIYKFDIRYKENGYHLFNMYAFSLLKKHGFGANFFNTSRFKKMLEYSFSNDIIEMFDNSNHRIDPNILPMDNQVLVNRYAYAYNAPGFELPYVYSTFAEILDNVHKRKVDKVIKNQLLHTFDNASNSFSNNTEDIETLNARIYEYSRCIL